MTIDDRDRLRAVVLRAYYDVQERMPGIPEQTAVIAHWAGRQKRDVDRAALYLAERGLLRIIQKEEFLGEDDVVVIAEITSAGIDVIERPERGRKVLTDETVAQITIVNGTHVTGGTVVNGGNVQIVRGDNTGTMVNASTTGAIAPPQTLFPIERLREMAPEGTPTRDAVETIAREVSSPTPALSQITGAFEILRGSAVLGDVAHTVSEWAKTPDVAHWLSTLGTRLFG